MAKIKRSQFKTFMDITPSGMTRDYELIGDGVTTGTIQYNPEATTETYIHEDSGTTFIERYAPNMPIEAAAVAGDDVFEFVDALRKERATLADAETTIVNVWLYEAPESGEYPAEQQVVSVQVDSFGGDGGTTARINYTINYVGEAVEGTFDPITKTFTAAS
jgi:hypothetical protein